MFLITEQGSLTIVRRSSSKKTLSRTSQVSVDDEALDAVDLTTDNLPAVDTPDACDKAALRYVSLRDLYLYIVPITPH